jgi:trimethylamine:corrinoid methyltransferase-like protein
MWRVLSFVLFISSPVYAVPVVPNFTQGSSSSRTETTTNITETIRTTNYNSGYTYSVTGSGIKHDGKTISAPNATVTETINGTTYTWTGLDLGEKPNWSLKKSGDAFQFTEVYTPPGLESVSDVTRTIQSESVTDTTTIFSQ